MKTSSKLLIGLALTLIIAMFGAAISLRSQYDKLDKSDNYAQWQKKPLPAFRAVQIAGPSATIVQIEPGKTTRLLFDSVGQWRKPAYTYRVERDTLFLKLNPVEGWSFNAKDEDDAWHDPRIVVQLPALTSVSTTNAFCQLHKFKGDTLTLQQGGKGGSLLVDRLTYNQLNASLSMHNQLAFTGLNNRITNAAITLRDSSRLFQYSDFLQGLTLTAAPGAKLRLTGKTLQQAQQ